MMLSRSDAPMGWMTSNPHCGPIRRLSVPSVNRPWSPGGVGRWDPKTNSSPKSMYLKPIMHDMVSQSKYRSLISTLWNFVV